MTAMPPSGPAGQWPAIIAGFPAGLAGFLSGHSWWGLAVVAVFPVVNVVVRDYLRPLLQAYGAVHPRRVRAVGRLKTDLKKETVNHRLGITRMRHRGALERAELRQQRLTQKKRAKAGRADLPGAGPTSLRAVSAEEATATLQSAGDAGQGRHRKAG